MLPRSRRTVGRQPTGVWSHPGERWGVSPPVYGPIQANGGASAHRCMVASRRTVGRQPAGVWSHPGERWGVSPPVYGPIQANGGASARRCMVPSRRTVGRQPTGVWSHPGERWGVSPPVYGPIQANGGASAHRCMVSACPRSSARVFTEADLANPSCKRAGMRRTGGLTPAVRHSACNPWAKYDWTTAGRADPRRGP
jgi:hypothetical protein